jgi:hypothetical protein
VVSSLCRGGGEGFDDTVASACVFRLCDRGAMDLFPNKQNFDLDKSRQNFSHSLKEHHKISNIPKFRCEML